MRSIRRKITPAEACKLLENTTFQRPLSSPFVERLVAQIKAGQWKCNGETIILDRKGRVLDGQHRLWACFYSDTTIESFVVEDADPELFVTIDTGRQRTFCDVASVEYNKEGLGAIVRKVMAAAIKIRVLIGTDGRPTAWGGGNATGNPDLLDWLRKHPEIVEQAKEIVALGRWPMPASSVLALYHAVHPGFKDCFDTFFKPLQAGTGLPKGSPILLLRNLLAHPWRTMKSRESFAYLIKAWNAHAEGKTLGVLRWTSIEAYPSIMLKPGIKPVHVHRGGPLTGATKTQHDKKLAREAAK